MFRTSNHGTETARVQRMAAASFGGRHGEPEEVRLAGMLSSASTLLGIQLTVGVVDIFECLAWR